LTGIPSPLDGPTIRPPYWPQPLISYLRNISTSIDPPRHHYHHHLYHNNHRATRTSAPQPRSSATPSFRAHHQPNPRPGSGINHYHIASCAQGEPRRPRRSGGHLVPPVEGHVHHHRLELVIIDHALPGQVDVAHDLAGVFLRAEDLHQVLQSDLTFSFSEFWRFVGSGSRGAWGYGGRGVGGACANDNRPR